MSSYVKLTKKIFYFIFLKEKRIENFIKIKKKYFTVIFHVVNKSVIYFILFIFQKIFFIFQKAKYRRKENSNAIYVLYDSFLSLTNFLFYYFIFFSDFNGDGKPDNITFMIKRIKVHNQNALKDPSYRFPGNYGVEKFLELFSGK